MWEYRMMIEAVRWALLALAVAWLIRRLRGGRQGNERTCRQCDYILENLPETSDRCPECGASLLEPNATQTGHRLSFKPPAVAVLAAVGVWIGAGFVNQTLQSRYIEYLNRPARLGDAAQAGDVTEVRRLLALEPTVVERASRHSTRTLTERAIVGGSAEVFEILVDAEGLKPPFKVAGKPRNWDSDFETLLHLAAAHDNQAALKLMIDRGASIDITDSLGRTPLHYAALSGIRFQAGGSMRVLPFLLERGAAIDATDTNGRTPLLNAVAERRGHLAAIQSLLSAGANVNVADELGRTALHWALRYGDYDLSKQLIAHGADWSAKDADGLTPFAAGAKEHPTIAYELSANTLRETKARHGMAAVKRLLTADPGIARLGGGERGWGTFLHNTDDLELMTAVLDAGADPNARHDGRTPLFGAGLPQTKLLLDRGANVNVADKEGVTPLLLALERSPPEVVNMLLERGARIEAHDTFGGDAMHYAAQNYMNAEQRPKRIQMLLDRGLPLSMSAAITLRRNGDVRRMIAERPESVSERVGASGFTPLHHAIILGNFEAADMLIRAGADLNARARHEPKHTPLSLALSFNKTELVAAIVNAGADLSIKTHGLTPLHAAASWGRAASLAQLMIDRGADLHVRDNNGNTPLHSACERGNVEVAGVLLAAGADRELRNNRQQRPVDVIVTTDAGPRRKLQALFDEALKP